MLGGHRDIAGLGSGSQLASDEKGISSVFDYMGTNAEVEALAAVTDLLPDSGLADVTDKDFYPEESVGTRST